METLDKIKEIISIDKKKINDASSFLNYVENNIDALQDIKDLNIQELTEIKVPFKEFVSSFRSEFLNADEYNIIYARLAKVAIYFYEKFNDIGSIRNILNYFRKEPEESPYKYKISALTEFRLLSNINDLPEKIRPVSAELNKALELKENKENLINILKEYFNKLFSLNEFYDLGHRKDYIKNLAFIDSLKPFLEEKTLKDYLNDKLEELDSTPTPPPIKQKPPKIVDLEIEIDLLKLEVEEKNKEIVALKKEISLLKSKSEEEKGSLTIEINLLKEEIKVLNSENSSLLQEIEKLKKNTADSEVIETLTKGNKILIERISKLNLKLNEISEQNQIKDKEIEKHINRINNLEKEIVDLKKRKKPPSDDGDDILGNVNIAILGSENGKKIFNKLIHEKYFTELGLLLKNLKFIETWRDEKKTHITDLVTSDIILIGENDHVLGGIKKLSQDAIYQQLKNDELFENRIIEKIKLEKNSTKSPKITKTSLKITLEKALEEYIIKKKNDNQIIN